MIAFGFAALLGTTPAAAQARQSADIPFSFVAGGVEYSEGSYTVERLANTVVKLTNMTNGKMSLILAPVPSGPEDHEAKLTFLRTADGMRLREIKFSGYTAMVTGVSSKETSAKVVVGLK